MSSILSKAVSPVAAKAKTQAKGDVTLFLAVFAYLAAASTRLTYAGMGVVAHACGMLNGPHEIGRPSSFRCISLLPAEQQYLVTSKSGSYKDGPLGKWGDKAPEGFASTAILADEHVEALVAEVKAASAK